MKINTERFRKHIKVFTFLLVFWSYNYSTEAYAGLDTTVFRINVVQDSVYAGDTVDVDFFIGGGLLGFLNVLKSFEIEVVTDTSLIIEDNIQFRLDSTSLESFFGVLISSITTIVTLDPVLGALNVKANAPTLGNGNARIGRGRYIVQDNVAGRQYMRYDYTKSISRDLLGFLNPVKTIVDSVLIIGRDTHIPTTVKQQSDKSIKISPNPIRDYIQIDGEQILQYKIISVTGKEIITSPWNVNSKNLQLNLNQLDNGIYLLMLRTKDNWISHRIIKE